MFHFFTSSKNFIDGKVYISGPDYNHIKNVIRLKCGDKAVVSDPDGGAYTCRIEEFTDTEVVFAVLEASRDNELPVNITLYQGLAKGDKFENIIQKCVELGATKIVPVNMHRSVVKLDDKKADSKVKRWNMISESAAKQSGRGIIPEVACVMNFDEAVNDAKSGGGEIVLAYEEAEGMKNLRELIETIKLDVANSEPSNSKDSTTNISLFIGPEGGFEEDEVEVAKEAGARIVSLGRRILRTETAGPALIAALMLEIEMNLER